MLADDPRFVKITEQIIGCAYKVANGLGVGFLEKVYENALSHELQKGGLLVEQQHPVDVWYDAVAVGVYVADVLVEGCVIIEVKAVAALNDSHAAQTLNYLRATGLAVALLINFGKAKIEIKRVANSSSRTAMTPKPNSF